MVVMALYVCIMRIHISAYIYKVIHPLKISLLLYNLRARLRLWKARGTTHLHILYVHWDLQVHHANIIISVRVDVCVCVCESCKHRVYLYYYANNTCRVFASSTVYVAEHRNKIKYMISRWTHDKEKLYTVGVGTGTTCGCGGWRRRPGGGETNCTTPGPFRLTVSSQPPY